MPRPAHSRGAEKNGAAWTGKQQGIAPAHSQPMPREDAFWQRHFCCCPGTSYLDSLKLILPGSCAFIGVSQSITMITVPLARGDRPRYGPASRRQ